MLRTAADGRFFLGRLENDFHSAVNLILHFIQYGGSAQKDGHVTVMAAGMHDAFVFGSKRKACELCYRKGIHVGPEGHRFPRMAAFDDAQYGILEKSCFIGDAQIFENILDIG